MIAGVLSVLTPLTTLSALQHCVPIVSYKVMKTLHLREASVHVTHRLLTPVMNDKYLERSIYLALMPCYLVHTWLLGFYISFLSQMHECQWVIDLTLRQWYKRR